ncbi:hypothetical protein BX600DRAFT_434712 [Xylariales sp. PMI_506]|nr:hypothetical protein BX600DRAFT_434712 [Xylariales sp. PMI_506]
MMMSLRKPRASQYQRGGNEQASEPRVAIVGGRRHIRLLVCEYPKQSPNEIERETMARNLVELRQNLKQHEDILHHLQTAPESEARTTVQRLRATPNVAAVISSIKSGVAPRRPSDIQAARAVLTSSQSRVEFELMVLHGKVYVELAPLNTSAAELQAIFQPRRSPSSLQSSTTSLLADYDASSSQILVDAQTIAPQALVTGSPSPFREIPDPRALSIQGPLRARVFCDHRLNSVQIGYWTKVPVSNEFAATLISVYLENEHPVVGTFDTDTFLDDLVALQVDCCSSFLVSSLLCLASQCYTAIDSGASPLAIAFLTEAETLWPGERNSDSPTSFAAMTTLWVASICLGRESLHLELMADCRQMAERLGLFGVRPTPELIKRFRQLPPRKLRAASHAAWGCYSLSSIHAGYYSGEPIKFPPALPVPGEVDISVITDWPAHPQPEYIGQTFATWCRLWTISQEVQAAYYQEAAVLLPLQEFIPIAFVEEKFQKLLAWADILAEDMTRKEHSASHVLVFHAYFHIIVLDIFRPFLRADENARLRSFSSLDSTPQMIFNASLRQLQRLLVLYCTSFDSRLYNFLLGGAVLHIMHVVLRDTSSAEGQFFIKQCMGWMIETFARYPAIGKAAQAHMTIGITEGTVTSAEAHAFIEELQRRGWHHNLANIAASYVVDFDKAMLSRSDGRVQNLAERFEELMLFEKLTTGEYDKKGEDIP